jgi:hypothetical protein
MLVPKNTRGRASCLLLRNLACGRTKFSKLARDCLLHEQIVILFPCCKVLSKEHRSHLNE